MQLSTLHLRSGRMDGCKCPTDFLHSHSGTCTHRTMLPTERVVFSSQLHLEILSQKCHGDFFLVDPIFI